MPIELQIIRASEFIRLGAQGHFELPASKTALTQLALACRKRNIDRAMLDLRAIHVGPTARFSPTDLAELVGTFHEAGFDRNQRLAVLYSTDPHHRVRMFAFMGAKDGWNVRAFEDFEQAMLWISEAAPVDQHPSEAQIPVQRRARPAGKEKPF